MIETANMMLSMGSIRPDQHLNILTLAMVVLKADDEMGVAWSEICSSGQHDWIGDKHEGFYTALGRAFEAAKRLEEFCRTNNLPEPLGMTAAELTSVHGASIPDGFTEKMLMHMRPVADELLQRRDGKQGRPATQHESKDG